MNAYLVDQDYHNEYNNMLDEQGDIKVAGYNFSPSQILKELDEIAYNEGYNDWVDNRYGEQWECGECGKQFDSKEDADECCQSEEVEYVNEEEI